MKVQVQLKQKRDKKIKGETDGVKCNYCEYFLQGNVCLSRSICTLL